MSPSSMQASEPSFRGGPWGLEGCTTTTALLVPSPPEIKQISKTAQQPGPGLDVGWPGQSTLLAQSEKLDIHRNTNCTSPEGTERPNPSSHSSAFAPGCCRHTDSKARTEQATSQLRKYPPWLAEGFGCPFSSQRTLMKTNALIHTHIHHQS